MKYVSSATESMTNYNTEVNSSLRFPVTRLIYIIQEKFPGFEIPKKNQQASKPTQSNNERRNKKTKYLNTLSNRTHLNAITYF